MITWGTKPWYLVPWTSQVSDAQPDASPFGRHSFIAAAWSTLTNRGVTGKDGEGAQRCPKVLGILRLGDSPSVETQPVKSNAHGQIDRAIATFMVNQVPFDVALKEAPSNIITTLPSLRRTEDYHSLGCMGASRST